MGRKQRTPKGRIELTPAIRLLLLAGELGGEPEYPDNAICHGWVGLEMWLSASAVRDAAGNFDYTVGIAALVDLHRETILREAAENGFTAWCVREVRPSGAGFERWRAAFLRAHTRRPAPPAPVLSSESDEDHGDHF